MTDTNLTLTTYAGNGNAPLSIAQIDGNWQAIMAWAATVMSGIVPLVHVDDSPDAQRIVVSINGDEAGQFTKPARPLNPRGLWTSGLDYAPQDTFRYEGSTYLVRVQHVSTAVDADMLANKIEVMAQAGAPGYVVRGSFSATQAYAVGDGVTVGGDPAVYVLGQPAPAGTVPKTDGSDDPYWARGTVSTLPSTLVVDAVYGRLSTVLGQIEAAMQSINTTLAAHAASLKTDADDVAALKARVQALENAASSSGGSTGTGSGSTGSGNVSSGGSGSATYTPSSAEVSNVGALRSFLTNLNPDMGAAGLSGYSKSLDMYSQDTATAGGLSSLVVTMTTFVSQLNADLGAADPFGSAPAGTFPLALPSWGAPSTEAGLKTVVGQLFDACNSINTALGQANTASISALNAGTYPKATLTAVAM